MLTLYSQLISAECIGYRASPPALEPTVLMPHDASVAMPRGDLHVRVLVVVPLHLVRDVRLARAVGALALELERGRLRVGLRGVVGDAGRLGARGELADPVAHCPADVRLACRVAAPADQGMVRVVGFLQQRARVRRAKRDRCDVYVLDIQY